MEYAGTGNKSSGWDDTVDRVVDYDNACKSVVFRDCVFQCNRARPLNLKSQNTLVEGCTFFNCSGAPIEAGPEKWWMEAPSVRSLTIRGCRFVNNAPDPSIDIGIFAYYQNSLHSRDNKNVLIEGCTFDRFGPNGAISVRNTQGLIVRNNIFREPKSGLNPGRKTLNILNCSGVVVSGNRGL